MKYILSILFILTVRGSYAQNQPLIRLNHLLIVVDSTTYTSLCNSKFINNEFGYSNQKQFKEWEGFYITGKNNYLEIFHPNSIKGKTLVEGDNWTCYASMKSEYIKSLVYDSTYFEFKENDYFKYLSCKLNDTLSPFEVWEMNELQYESWTKKEFESEMLYQSVDYNSPAESDSSQNYLFHDIVGIIYNIPLADSVKATNFFEVCGYSITERTIDRISFDNGTEKVTLFFKDDCYTVSIKSIELKLNQNYMKKTYLIGLSKLILNGYKAMWYF